MTDAAPDLSRMDWESLRQGLSTLEGREYWRRLEELSTSPSLRRTLEEHLPRPAAALPEGMDRREFVTLLGAALALAGFSGCGRPPAEKIIPYVRQPESLVPGKPLFYATALPHPGGATGILVRSDMGRPTKVEGNPRHPASLGATDVHAQAAIYSLWDPDRSGAVTRAGVPSTWSLFEQDLHRALAEPWAQNGKGLAVVTEECLSPSEAAQLARLLRTAPEARWYSHEPLGRDRLRAGMRLAFGRDAEPIYRLQEAD
ncbi:MAG TPA: TAT-variant-translocated molybdopterin oxidoreductase, partial [Planctomycetota bacterium]|nr:TAT-variant-translocated molybdopterin oxidoreductase [Planctomycetota bacterium]